MRQRGYTIMELVMTLAIFGVVMAIVGILTLEMRKQEAKYPVNLMAHPDVSALIARMRKDVFDAKYLPAEFQGYTQTSKTLILYSVQQTGFAETIVYDFSIRGEVHRKIYNSQQLAGEWVAHAVPDFQRGDYDLGTGQTAVRLTARDDQQRLAIDEILVPRPHE